MDEMDDVPTLWGVVVSLLSIAAGLFSLGVALAISLDDPNYDNQSWSTEIKSIEESRVIIYNYDTDQWECMPGGKPAEKMKVCDGFDPNDF